MTNAATDAWPTFDVSKVLHPQGRTEPRDRSFKLLEIISLKVMPVARLLRPTSFFVSVGFEPETDALLQSIYGRNDVPGCSWSGALPGADAGAQLLSHLRLASRTETSSRFDCLSLMQEAASRPILDLVCSAAYRPALIHCADVSAFSDWPAIKARLTANGYASVGALDGAELFLDGPLFAAVDQNMARPKVTTFNVFDTLLVRPTPDRVPAFNAVADRLKIDDFVSERQSAELRAALASPAYTLDHVYDELARRCGIDADAARTVRACEVAVEARLLVPVAETIARVKDGDILINNSRYSEAEVRLFLKGAGMDRTISLLAVPNHSDAGAIWSDLRRNFDVETHVCSAESAAVSAPALKGVRCDTAFDSALNGVEAHLRDAGLPRLAELARSARLATWNDDPALRLMQVVQASLNMPLLTVASVHLARRAERERCTRILFSGRDCNLWLPLFEDMQDALGYKGKAVYFMTSRIARVAASNAYKAYTMDLMGERGMIVDLCGTGWSTANLAEKLGLGACQTYYIDHRPPLAAYENKARTPNTCIIHKLVTAPHAISNIALECANFASHPMLLDMREINGCFLPVFAEETRDAAQLRAISAQRQTFLKAVDLMKTYDVGEITRLDDAALAALGLTLYAHLDRNGGAYKLFLPDFHSENNAVFKKLTAA